MSFVTELAGRKATSGREQAACWEWMKRNGHVSVCNWGEEGQKKEKSEECRTQKLELGGMQHVRLAGPAGPAGGRLTWMRIFPKQTDGVLSSAINMTPWK